MCSLLCRLRFIHWNLCKTGWWKAFYMCVSPFHPISFCVCVCRCGFGELCDVHLCLCSVSVYLYINCFDFIKLTSFEGTPAGLAVCFWGSRITHCRGAVPIICHSAYLPWCHGTHTHYIVVWTQTCQVLIQWLPPSSALSVLSPQTHFLYIGGYRLWKIKSNLSYHCGFAVFFFIMFPLFKAGYWVESAVMNHTGKQNCFSWVAEVFVSKSSIPTISNDSNNTMYCKAVGRTLWS